MTKKSPRRLTPAWLYRAVGRRLQAERIRRNVSQARLAAHLGVTRASVSNMEAGRTAIMLVHVYNTVRYLDIPIARLLP